MIDPEYARYKRQYPKFPGVPAIVTILRRHNARGGYLEIVLHDLEVNAAMHMDALIAAFREEPDEHVRILLFAAIACAGLPSTIPLLQEILQQDKSGELSPWAIRGLKQINTKEARRILYEARSNGLLNE